MIFLNILLALFITYSSACPYAGKHDLSPEQLERIHRSLQSSPLGPPQCSLPLNRDGDFCNVFIDIVKAIYFNLPLESRQRLYGPMIRLAFHDAGEANIAQSQTPDYPVLGPDGCLNTVDTSNAGLIESNQEVATVLESIWQSFCDRISRADFWALVASLAIMEAQPAPVQMINYYRGRVDSSDCSSGKGRLPDATLGLNEISRVFVDQMGLTLEDAVALIGAHSLGHVYPGNSGFGVLPGTTQPPQQAPPPPPPPRGSRKLFDLMATSSVPSIRPTKSPTISPTRVASTFRPSRMPTQTPTRAQTTYVPSKRPSFNPTPRPSSNPTSRPTFRPSTLPPISPTLLPTLRPTNPRPTATPSTLPPTAPTLFPTRKHQNPKTPKPRVCNSEIN